MKKTISYAMHSRTNFPGLGFNFPIILVKETRYNLNLLFFNCYEGWRYFQMFTGNLDFLFFSCCFLSFTCFAIGFYDLFTNYKSSVSFSIKAHYLPYVINIFSWLSSWFYHGCIKHFFSMWSNISIFFLQLGFPVFFEKLFSMTGVYYIFFEILH